MIVSLVQDLAITTDKQLIRRIQTAISLWKNGLVEPQQALAQAKEGKTRRKRRIF